MVGALQTLVSRNCSPTETMVISVTEFHGGDAFNVIPDQVRMKGTARYFNPDIGQLAQSRLDDVITSICTAHQVSATVEYLRGYPPTVNWDAPARIARQAAQAVFGAEHVVDQKPLMFAEDFSFFLQKYPGCYGFIGNGDSGALGCTGLHNPHYDFNDSILVQGAAYLAQVAEDALREARP